MRRGKTRTLERNMAMPPAPESILPPPSKIGQRAKAALIAFAITAVLSLVGFSLSFYLTHGAGVIERAVAILLLWPALVVMLAFGESGLPDFVFYVAVVVFEYLYIWGLVALGFSAAQVLRRGKGVAL